MRLIKSVLLEVLALADMLVSLGKRLRDAADEDRSGLAPLH